MYLVQSGYLISNVHDLFENSNKRPTKCISQINDLRSYICPRPNIYTQNGMLRDSNHDGSTK